MWKKFTKHPSDIYDKEQEKYKVIIKKCRLKYDLHGFTLDEANKKITEIILSSYNQYKEILLITGKGLHSNTDKDVYASKELSKLKFSVPEFINKNKELSKYVASISEAAIKDGGSGAILIKLKSL